MSSFRRLMVSMLVLLAGAAVLPFVLPLQAGKPLMRFADIAPPELPEWGSVMEKLPLPENSDTGGTEVTLQRWKGADGNWHFGDEAPNHATAVETMRVPTDANVVRSRTGTDPTGQDTSGAANPMERAADVEEVLKARKRRQGAAVSGE